MCSKVCSGTSDTDIKKQVGIDDSYLTKFKAKCSQYCAMTPAEETQLCGFIAMFKISRDQAKLAYPKVHPDDVDKAYDKCVAASG